MIIAQLLEIRRILDRAVASFYSEEEKNRTAGVPNGINAGQQHRIEAQRAIGWVDEELDRIQGVVIPPFQIPQ